VASCVTSVFPTLAANMVPASDHGSVTVLKDGEDSSVTKVTVAASFTYLLWLPGQSKLRRFI
jgi:hypothetical protein